MEALAGELTRSEREKRRMSNGRTSACWPDIGLLAGLGPSIPQRFPGTGQAAIRFHERRNGCAAIMAPVGHRRDHRESPAN
jgi:hypothetical protein